uniref:Uncharacterized protein n=1 Tax=Arundo donax TaxID=35708 RepID=A0A0A9B175_ARUDO
MVFVRRRECASAVSYSESTSMSSPSTVMKWCSECTGYAAWVRFCGTSTR